MYSNITFRKLRESTRKTPKYQTTSKVNQYILRYNIPLELYLTTLKTLKKPYLKQYLAMKTNNPNTFPSRNAILTTSDHTTLLDIRK